MLTSMLNLLLEHNRDQATRMVAQLHLHQPFFHALEQACVCPGLLLPTLQASMKRNAADRVLTRILNARQFALKMIANVT
jgi:hypothetical protein